MREAWEGSQKSSSGGEEKGSVNGLEKRNGEDMGSLERKE